MKSVSRSKLFLCFRPLDLESDGVDCSADRVFSYISAANTQHVGRRSPDRKSASLRRSFSGSLKAVFLEMSLSKRVRERRERKIRQRSTSDVSDDLTENSKNQSEIMEEADHEISPATTLCRCSSSESETSPENTKWVELNSKKNRGKRNELEWNEGIYVVVVSLWITVLWGRMFAVVSTTFWVFLFRLWKHRRDICHL